MNKEDLLSPILKPCPFCGKENPKLWQTGGYWNIKCVDGCSISISGYSKKSGAIIAWNMRPGENALVNYMERLLKILQTYEAENPILQEFESGVSLVSLERRRQLNEEGWSANHDDLHRRFELSRAAMAYLNASSEDLIKQFWPFEWSLWKPTTQIRNFVKAGALICAEIDRLLRKEKGKP